ncbi:transmembrane protein 250-like [Ptychodera flava]|uniref:transmembrane protein 250-like n=1 Tax=Ptychodera flava TaxID=63121 RepID=UPI00396A3987
MSKLKRSSKEDSSFDLYRRNLLLYGLLRFMLFFTASQATFLAFLVSGVTFIVQYVSIHGFLRFQYKLTVLLIMINRDRLNFQKFNDAFIYCIHIVMLLVGGFGWCCLMFIEN